MANQATTPRASNGADFGQCEYVPFGADEKIKLSFDLILRWLAVKTAKGAVPGEQDLMKFLMTCKARKLNPFDGDAFLVGYDGKDGPVFSTIVAHQAFLKRAETHPEFDGMESGVIVQIGDTTHELVGDFYPDGARLLGGWATVFFVNRRHPMTKRLRLATFDKGRSLWKTNPEGMIVKCAEADALRSSFAQLIGGMYLREEMDAGQAPVSTQRPQQLQDRRADNIPAPFAGQPRQRVYADASGVAVDVPIPDRYPQTADALEAEARLRRKESAVDENEQRTTANNPGKQMKPAPPCSDLYLDLLAKCTAASTKQELSLLGQAVSAGLGADTLTEDEAADLNAVLQDKIENMD